MSWHGPVRFDRWSLLAVGVVVALYAAMPRLGKLIAAHDTQHGFEPLLIVPYAIINAGALFVIFRWQPGQRD
jgi:hypothetical protein